jgi:hypothetical protein
LEKKIFFLYVPFGVGNAFSFMSAKMDGWRIGLDSLSFFPEIKYPIGGQSVSVSWFSCCINIALTFVRHFFISSKLTFYRVSVRANFRLIFHSLEMDGHHNFSSWISMQEHKRLSAFLCLCFLFFVLSIFSSSLLLILCLYPMSTCLFLSDLKK